MKDKEVYIDFDEYIRQGEPAQRERAEAWSIAIGLQAVDGLKVSEYLKETAERTSKATSPLMRPVSSSRPTISQKTART